MAIVYANNDNFNELIANGTVLVDFYADWCGPCKMLSPILEELSQEYDDVKFVKVNIDNSKSIAESYGIMHIPTLYIFKEGKVNAQTVGFMPKEKVKSWINSNK
ncbi:MAG TPA: thioredoxin [Haloplasmataceae bacterium]